jgi:hypothetical protein
MPRNLIAPAGSSVTNVVMMIDAKKDCVQLHQGQRAITPAAAATLSK